MGLLRLVECSKVFSGVLQVAMSKFDPAPLPYAKLTENLEIVKKRLGRDMTLSEKVLYSHLDDPKGQVKIKIKFSVKLRHFCR